jgi:hypothetical protein
MLRISRLLPITVLALALLFTVLEPGPSRGMALPVALLYWICHIGIGLLLAVAATALLARSRLAWPLGQLSPWPQVIAGGLLGSMLFAPVALGLEAYWPATAGEEMPDGLLDRWELQGGLFALIAEWLQLAPSYLASWLLLNAAPIWMQTVPSSSALSATGPTHPARLEQPDPVKLGAEVSRIPEEASASLAADCDFLQQLPPAIGTDVITIRSDLHYLQVRTVIGRAMLLGSIGMAEAALGERGLRVHRSYWVALRHVRRVGRSGNGCYCLLSDGSRVPVSRRRATVVRERLGIDFVIDSELAPG